jgi:histone-lysine N-methyltransferase SETMAR
LARYHEGDNFLQHIVTGDETRVHHYQPETKQKSKQWKHPSSLIAKKFKMQQLAGKLMLTTFWDSQGPILETYLERGTTGTSTTYCDMLQRGLKPAIHCKRRGKLSKGVLLLHDNACLHTVTCTLETLRKLKQKVMEHPAHSPHLAPSDLHLFVSLKEAVGGRRCRCHKDVKNAVHQWLCAQPKTLYYYGIQILVGHWEICVEKQGDYVEK